MANRLKLVRKAESQQQIHGLKLSRYAPPLSHLFYADGAFICCKATPASFEALRDIFHSFEDASGQMINLEKSFIKFIPNSPDDFKSHMTSILRMKASSSFGTYLSVPVDLPKQKTTVFNGLIDKITTRISSWSSLHRSQASKFVIINSILLGSLVHILAAVPLPFSITRKLDSLIAAFWWSKNTSSRRSIHWLSQQHLHVPRDNGGLGIKSVTILSQAYLMKNFWRLQHKSVGLLAKYLTPKYQKDLPVPELKSKVTQPSYGEPPKLRRDHSTTVPTISELVHDNGSWKPQLIFRLFEQYTAMDILAMEQPALEFDDFLYWKYTKDGSYNIQNSFQSGYTATFSTSLSGLVDRYYVRATSLFDAYSQALLQLMLRPQLDPFSSITFWVTSRKLFSVLASQRPVPIDARNSLREIRLLLHLHRNWSVSLATG
ncbi:uncharacterized protein LOC141628272 [Silene latifolia]|uniref:uncharacterized protein LOC141628272 n=1 Tax=Silene latifolia TaxID=37657 RepID=UPI003D77F19E